MKNEVEKAYVGEDVVLTWTVVPSDGQKIFITMLFLGSTTEIQLWENTPNKFKNLDRVAFGDRVSAVLNKNVFNLTVSNVNVNDSVTLLFRVGFNFINGKTSQPTGWYVKSIQLEIISEFLL